MYAERPKVPFAEVDRRVAEAGDTAERPWIEIDEPKATIAVSDDVDVHQASARGHINHPSTERQETLIVDGLDRAGSSCRRSPCVDSVCDFLLDTGCAHCGRIVELLAFHVLLVEQVARPRGRSSGDGAQGGHILHDQDLVPAAAHARLHHDRKPQPLQHDIGHGLSHRETAGHGDPRLREVSCRPLLVHQREPPVHLSADLGIEQFEDGRDLRAEPFDELHVHHVLGREHPLEHFRDIVQWHDRMVVEQERRRDTRSESDVRGDPNRPYPSSPQQR